jgi:peptide deformylase
MLLKIVEAGDPVLRRAARPLSREEILSPRVELLIALMRETMREAPGVGLAAPQIGESLQLAVIEDRPEVVAALPAEQRAERRRAPVPFQVLINPSVAVVDPTPAEFFEGCLSAPPYAALVARASVVRVEALNENAQPISFVAEGWHARIVQHEVDHLNGVLYVDRMRTRSLTTQANLQRYWAGRGTAETRAALEIDDAIDR